MNVLSLFDGISVARQAFHNTDIPINKYYCCEIDKYAIQVSKKNWKDNIHFGSVVDFSNTSLDIDFLIGGSPCQDLSIAKKGRKGLDGDRSGLFWEYVRIKDLIKPKYFILENVASMAKKDRDIITEAMGVEPIMFNASLVSAQCRKRLFWTNIKFDLPEDKGILLKDILQEDGEVDERMITKGKSYTLTATYSGADAKNSIERKQRTMVGRIVNRKLDANGVRRDKQEDLEYTTQIEPNLNDKSNCLTTVQKDNVVIFTKTAQTGRNETKKLGFIDNIDHQANRVYDINGKLPALNAICNSRVNDNTKSKKIGHIGKSASQGNRVYSIEGKSVTLSANGGGLGAKTGLYEIDNIRKLTPIECERLQSLPDNYTDCVSNSQRYKCLGNAFNCKVIEHILLAI
jgi:DNA (cytosine-5)-methyltransferase 3A